MTDRELMQQALNLLDDINQCSLPPTGIPLPAEIDHVMETLRARLAQPEQEPEVSVCCQDYDSCIRPCTPRGQWIAHKAAQREWQGLTDETEIKHCWYEACQTDLELTSQLVVYFARAIEAKLKEKNNG